jgi:hypothetical protein
MQIDEAATQAPLLLNQSKQHFWPALHFHVDCLPVHPVALHIMAFGFAAAPRSNPIGGISVSASVHAKIEIGVS